MSQSGYGHTAFAEQLQLFCIACRARTKPQRSLSRAYGEPLQRERERVSERTRLEPKWLRTEFLCRSSTESLSQSGCELTAFAEPLLLLCMAYGACKKPKPSLSRARKAGLPASWLADPTGGGLAGCTGSRLPFSQLASSPGCQQASWPPIEWAGQKCW